LDIFSVTKTSTRRPYAKRSGKPSSPKTGSVKTTTIIKRSPNKRKWMLRRILEQFPVVDLFIFVEF
jgi:hypothetical protein